MTVKLYIVRKADAAVRIGKTEKITKRWTWFAEFYGRVGSNPQPKKLGTFTRCRSWSKQQEAGQDTVLLEYGFGIDPDLIEKHIVP